MTAIKRRAALAWATTGALAFFPKCLACLGAYLALGRELCGAPSNGGTPLAWLPALVALAWAVISSTWRRTARGG